MHAFVIVVDLRDIHNDRIDRALAGIAREFMLDPGTGWRASSASGRIRVAGVHHATESARPRRYVFREGSRAVWFDGLPVDARADFEAADAGELARRWADLPERIEGQFVAAELDLERESVELLTDTLGLLPAYVAGRNGGMVLSNSASVVASLLALREPDRLALSSMLALGWAVERRTLLEGVRALPGGAVHRIDRSKLSSRSHYSSSEVVARRQRRGRNCLDVSDVAGDLVEVTRAAVRGKSPLVAPLTAGRDTRLMMALTLRTPAEIEYYTGGQLGDADVVFAERLAREFHLQHRVESRRPEAIDVETAARFVRQNDGLIPLHQLGDHIELERPVERLGVTLWGVGGEIARAGTGDISALAPNLPVLSRLVEVQRRLLARKVDNDAGLLTPQAAQLVVDYIDRFVDERRAEGWPTREVAEAFYAFERVGCWGATGPRRAAIARDVFSPFATRAFIDYALSLRPAERYLEAAHYRLLGTLSVAARDSPFEVPFAAQQPGRVPFEATRRLLKSWRGQRRRRNAKATAYSGETYFAGEWFEQHVDHVRELFSAAQPALWELLDRGRLQQLLAASPSQRAEHLEALLRATTVAWYLALPNG